ncbi:hypothetical protein MMC25_007300 [Agyrium rufum]|nr:hypothetical protein [Agyrium rufum]
MASRPIIQSRRFLSLFHDYTQLSRACCNRAAVFPQTSLNPHRAAHSNGFAQSFSTSSVYRVESLRHQSHYEYFPDTLPSGAPPKGPFAVDTRALRREFLQLQAKAHPDRHQGEDKSRAEGASALINEAYKTLQDPLRRAQYLLSLRGIEVAEDETAKTEDPDLLMEVLEVREDIEAAESEDDLLPLQEHNERRIEHSVDVLDDAFAKDDLERAKTEAVRLRYWVNIKDSLEAWEPGKPVVLMH